MYKYKRRKQSGGTVGDSLFGNIDINELLSGLGGALQGFSNEPALKDVFNQSDNLFNQFQNQAQGAGFELDNLDQMKPVFDIFSIFSKGMFGSNYEDGGKVTKKGSRKLRKRYDRFRKDINENLIDLNFERKKDQFINEFNSARQSEDAQVRQIIPGMSQPSRVKEKGGPIPYNPNKVDVDSYLKRFNNAKDSITTRDIKSIQERLMQYGHKVTPEFIISQAQLEGVFNDDGGRSKKNNPFNVGEFDSGTMMTFDSREQGLKAFADLLAKDYLGEARTEQDLLNEYTNLKGYRYASNPNYESDLKNQINFIRDRYKLSEPPQPPTPAPNFQPPNDVMGFQQGGQIPISPQGQFAFPGQPVMVPTGNGQITMNGVNEPLFAMDMLGNAAILPPNSGLYQFGSDLVYEEPIRKRRKTSRKSKKTKDDNKGIKTGIPRRTVERYNRRNRRTQSMNRRGNVGLPFGNKIGY